MFEVIVHICQASSLCTFYSPQFPVPPEPDHSSMLRKVRNFPYEMPLSFSPSFALLITEVITQKIILLQNIKIYYT